MADFMEGFSLLQDLDFETELATASYIFRLELQLRLEQQLFLPENVRKHLETLQEEESYRRRRLEVERADQAFGYVPSSGEYSSGRDFELSTLFQTGPAHVAIGPWHGGDFILQRFELEELQALGYLEAPEPFQDELKHGIHPIFEYKNFVGVCEEDYGLLNQTLRLASRILVEPKQMPFWHALFFGTRKLVRNEKLHRHYDRFIYRFDLKRGGISRDDLDAVYAMMRILANKNVKISFADTGTADGVTCAQAHNPDPFFGGCHSNMVLHANFIKCLRDYRDRMKMLKDYQELAAVSRGKGPRQYPIEKEVKHPNQNPPLSRSSMMRMQVLLAITILHELGHVISWATTLYQWTHYFTTTALVEDVANEAFFGNQRIAEIGKAYESAVFHGMVNPVGIPCHQSARFGLSHCKWPTFIDTGQPQRSRSRYGWNSSYLVPMEWVRGMWSTAFWDRVAVEGIRTLWPPRRLGLRTVNLLAWNGESAEDEFASDSEDDNYPDTCEGRRDRWIELDRRHRIAVVRRMTVRPNDDTHDSERSSEYDSAGDNSSYDRLGSINGTIRIGVPQPPRTPTPPPPLPPPQISPPAYCPPFERFSPLPSFPLQAELTNEDLRDMNWDPVAPDMKRPLDEDEDISEDGGRRKMVKVEQI